MKNTDYDAVIKSTLIITSKNGLLVAATVLGPVCLVLSIILVKHLIALAKVLI